MLEDGRPAAVKSWDTGGPWRSLRARFAALREHTSRSWRGRAWRAYLEELGERSSRAEVRAIEARAQERRRAVIARAQRRWLRDSSSCVRRRGSQGKVLASRDLSLAGSEVLELRPHSPARAPRLWPPRRRLWRP